MRRPGPRSDKQLPSYDGWFRFNENYWRTDWPDFAHFFFDQMCCEPHSTKVLEDVGVLRQPDDR